VNVEAVEAPGLADNDGLQAWALGAPQNFFFFFLYFAAKNL
jgi:hypothetical protein